MPLYPKYTSIQVFDAITKEKQSLQEIATKIGCNKETIKKYIKPLVNEGLVIEIKEKYGNLTGYTYKYLLK